MGDVYGEDQIVTQTPGGAAGDGSIDGALTISKTGYNIFPNYNLIVGTIGVIRYSSSLGGSVEWQGGIGTLAVEGGCSYFRSIITAAGSLGLSPIYGLDNRTGLTAADASAITLYAVPAAGGLFRLSGGLDCTAYTSGTGTYTITWTDVNGTTHTITGSLSAVGHVDLATSGLLRVKGGTNVTAQLTGTFVGTFDADSAVEQLA